MNDDTYLDEEKEASNEIIEIDKDEEITYDTVATEAVKPTKKKKPNTKICTSAS